MGRSTECICECGRQVPLEINGIAAGMMLELVELDRFRALLRSSESRNQVGLDLSNTDSFMSDGATLYRHALDSMHGESSWTRDDEKTARRWIKFSRRSRRKLHRDTDGFVRKDKLPPLMTPDREYLDRRHPEKIYSSRIEPDGRLVRADAPPPTSAPASSSTSEAEPPPTPAPAPEAELVPSEAPSPRDEPLMESIQDPSAAAPARPADIAICFTSNIDKLYAEAVVVVKEKTDDGSKKFANHYLSFTHDHRPAVFMDGDLSSMITDVERFDSRKEATAEARQWIDGPVERAQFELIPGIFQAAMWSYLLGVELEASPGWFGWVIPGDKGIAMARDFPPRLEPTDITPEPGTVTWALIPNQLAWEMQRGIAPRQ